MRPVRSLLFYLLTVFLGGALLAPWVYWGGNAVAEMFPALGGLARVPFHRFENRCILILAVLGLWPLLRHLGVGSWKDLGLVASCKRVPLLVRGFALGFGSLALAAGLVVVSGARQLDLDHSPARFVQHLVGALLVAGVVATLEEIIFRGALFGALRRVHSLLVALVGSSFVYALVHFHRPEPPAAVTLTTGLQLLPEMLQPSWPDFLNLFLAGIILANACRWSGNLYQAIGLHGGWIFWLKSFGFLTATVQRTAWSGTGKLIDGWMVTLVLLPLCLLSFQGRLMGRGNDKA